MSNTVVCRVILMPADLNGAVSIYSSILGKKIKIKYKKVNVDLYDDGVCSLTRSS